MTMRAAVLREVGRPMTIERVTLADPGPGEARVRIVAAGVCHSDYHVIKGEGATPLPIILGHEASGVVEASLSARTIAGDEKTLKGSFYGSSRMRIDMPRLVDFYMDGRLLLDELVTRTYPLDQINEAYDDLGRGGVGRGLLLPHGL